MRVLYRVRPYEKEKGSATRVHYNICAYKHRVIGSAYNENDNFSAHAVK